MWTQFIEGILVKICFSSLWTSDSGRMEMTEESRGVLHVRGRMGRL